MCVMYTCAGSNCSRSGSSEVGALAKGAGTCVVGGWKDVCFWRLETVVGMLTVATADFPGVRASPGSWSWRSEMRWKTGEASER